MPPDPTSSPPTHPAPYNLRPRRPSTLDTAATPRRAPSPTLTRRRPRPASALRASDSPSSAGSGSASGSISGRMSNVARSGSGQRRRKGAGTGNGSGAKTTNGSVLNGAAAPLEQPHPASSDAPPTSGVDAPRPTTASPARNRPTRARTNSLSLRHWRKLNLELPRKTLHSSIGLITLALFFVWPADKPTTPIVSIIFGILCLILLGDLLRFQFPAVRRIWEKYLGKFMRESEKTKINGTVWYCLGAMICLQLYPRDIAVTSILILSWCDTAASFFGRLITASRRLSPYSPALPNPLFGYIPIARKKSLGGTFAGGIVGSVIARGMFGSGWGGCLGVGVIAGLAEAVDVGGLDDNLTLPVLSGALIWALRVLTGSV